MWRAQDHDSSLKIHFRGNFAFCPETFKNSPEGHSCIPPMGCGVSKLMSREEDFTGALKMIQKPYPENFRHWGSKSSGSGSICWSNLGLTCDENDQRIKILDIVTPPLSDFDCSLTLVAVLTLGGAMPPLDEPLFGLSVCTHGMLPLVCVCTSKRSFGFGLMLSIYREIHIQYCLTCLSVSIYI